MPRVLRIAILDEQLPARIREAPERLDGIEVAWAGDDLEQLARVAAELRPAALALDLDLLGDSPLAEAGRLAQRAGAGTVFLLYRLARGDLLRAAARAGVRPVRAPITLDELRALLASADAPDAVIPEPASVARERASRRRFTAAQLTRLLDLGIENERSRELASLVLSMHVIEERTQPAEVHRRVARSTAEARAILEDALAALLVHERIVL